MKTLNLTKLNGKDIILSGFLVLEKGTLFLVLEGRRPKLQFPPPRRSLQRTGEITVVESRFGKENLYRGYHGGFTTTEQSAFLYSRDSSQYLHLNITYVQFSKDCRLLKSKIVIIYYNSIMPTSIWN